MRKDIIIFDLDGTLADISHRLHHIRDGKKNWRAFFAACDEDVLIPHTFELLDTLHADYDIWIVSGRSDECRDATEDWLYKNNINYVKLIMRKEGDYTPDDELKPSWLHDGTIPQERVLCVFDDRKKVVDAWRKHGIPCMQVAEGNF